MSHVQHRDFTKEPRLRCDLPGCRRTHKADTSRFNAGWEVWGTTMDVFDFCSVEHLDTFYAAHPEWHNQ